jgi:hypothetical protein
MQFARFAKQMQPLGESTVRTALAKMGSPR